MQLLLLFVIGLVSGLAEASEDAIRKAIISINPAIQVQSVELVKSTPFFEVILHTGERVYTDSSATYLMTGDLYKIESGGAVNITEAGRRSDRQKLFVSLRNEDLVVFSPAGEIKHRLLIFTDIDCGYCRKLHAEIDYLLKNGVEVRYAAFPRSGVNSESFEKYVSVVCAENQQKAMTEAKLGNEPKVATCSNQVEEQLRLGQKLGITGTPTLIFEDGGIQPGYSPWKELLNRMNKVGS